MELHPQIETLLLLAAADRREAEKAAVLAHLGSIGLRAEEVYGRHFRIVEKYYAAFARRMKKHPGNEPLGRAGRDSLLLLYVHIFFRRPEWFDGLGGSSDAELRAEVALALNEMLETDGGIVEALEAAGLPAEEKWRIMLLGKQPRRQLEAVAEAVRENLAAYAYARGKVSDELGPLLRHAEALLGDPAASRVFRIAHNIAPGAPIIPSLASPARMIIMENMVLCGLLTDKMAEEMFPLSRENLTVCAKALGDKSKVEILAALKEGPLYGTQIAERVGLTPATVSHHLNHLLLADFITLERRDGKVYCRLSEAGIERFMQGIAQLLLQKEKDN